MHAHLLSALWLQGCSLNGSAPTSDMVRPAPSAEEQEDQFAAMGYFDEELADAGEGGRAPGANRDMVPARFTELLPPEDQPEPEPMAAPPPPADASPEGNSRTWFPETFLFSPRLVTGADGAGELTVTVPDRLTTWRVLGLAHARSGATAGDVLTFQGTLPVYVDPVVPPFLRTGDQLRLPIQMVNTTAQSQTLSLAVTAEGAGFVQGGDQAVTIPANGSALQSIVVTAERPGALVVQTTLGAEDAIVQSIDVHPTGHPVQSEHSGVLSAPSPLSTAADAQATPDSGRARLVVYPGALSVLKSELLNISVRSEQISAMSLDDILSGTSPHVEIPSALSTHAYALMLAARGPAFLEQMGSSHDPEALRTLRLTTTQRIVRSMRSLTSAEATLLVEATLSHPDDPVLQRVGMQMVNHLLRNQLPDGTLADGDGWTLQRLLVATANTSAALTRSLPLIDDPEQQQRIQRALLLAGTAQRRLAQQINDPYTAAAVVVGGGLDDALTAQLQQLVRDGVAVEDGRRQLTIPDGVVRADGRRPSLAEANALAAMALQGDAEAAAWIDDLGSSILAAYSPGHGWGDGQASLHCLQALMTLFDEPLPEQLTITMEMDGVVIAEGQFDRSKLTEVLILDAIGLDMSQPHQFTAQAQPSIAGLGYTLSAVHRTPWGAPPTNAGLQAELVVPSTLIAGQPTTVSLQAAAPAGVRFSVEHELPAGVLADEQSLNDLVDNDQLQSVHIEDGLIRMQVDALNPGEALNIQYTVVPTLAGRLHSGPLRLSSLSSDAETVHYPPSIWEIRSQQ